MVLSFLFFHYFVHCLTFCDVLIVSSYRPSKVAKQNVASPVKAAGTPFFMSSVMESEVSPGYSEPRSCLLGID